MATIPLHLNGRDVSLHKAVMQPIFVTQTVLTNSPWNYVALWLRRKNKHEALFYWEQAQQFHNASRGLPLRSAPLLLYYSYMDLAKALLTAKAMPFAQDHGVKAHKMRQPNDEITLSNEGIRIKARGIVSALANYYHETELQRDYTMQELFFSMAFIHRTYCLTYQSQQEMFVPLQKCKYTFDDKTGRVFCEGWLATDIAGADIRTRLPTSMDWVGSGAKQFRSKSSIPWSDPNGANDTELAALAGLHAEQRFSLHYINGAQTLWYLKLKTDGPRNIMRRPSTVTLCAMHRLSEICRYRPSELSSFLDGDQNWLLSEFVDQSPKQFLDEIASELTGQQFLVPNIRIPI